MLPARKATPPLTIGVALSGGVDSAVTALLLRHLVHTRRELDWWLRDPWPVMCPSSPPPYPSPLKGLPTGGFPPFPLNGDSAIKVIESRVGLRDEDNSSTLHTISQDSGEGIVENVRLVGYFMHNWRQQEHDDWEDSRSAVGSARRGLYCEQSEKERHDAEDIARHSLVKLDDFKVVDFSTQYYHNVFEQMTEAFFRGSTLNADTLCNRHIKFGNLLTHASRLRTSNNISSLVGGHGDGRCEFLATGHYAHTCRNWQLPAKNDSLKFPCTRLLTPASRGTDLNDQTHFLSSLCPYSQLPRALFPLGRLMRSKEDVRKVASHFLGDVIGRKKTSTGLCFVSFPRASPLQGGQTNSSVGRTLQEHASPNTRSKRAVVRQSAFRTLLAQKYREENYPPPQGTSDVSFFLDNGGLASEAETLRSSKSVGLCDEGLGIVAAAHAPITPIPSSHVLVADDNVYPFDFPQGAKVQIVDPGVGGTGSKAKATKRIITTYVCKKELTTTCETKGQSGTPPSLPPRVQKVYLTQSRACPLLHSRQFSVLPSTISWVAHPQEVKEAAALGDFLVSCRHQDAPSSCTWDLERNLVTLTSDSKWCVTPGQTAVFYVPVVSEEKDVGIVTPKTLMVVASATIE